MLPLHLLYQPGDLNLVTAYTTHQYLEELRQHLRTTFAFAQQQLQRSSEGRKAYYDKNASHHELNVRDKVWYYNFARPRQNAPHRLSNEVPSSLDRTPRDRRQALTCRLPNQNHSRAQRASSSMGPSKPVKGGDQTH